MKTVFKVLVAIFIFNLLNDILHSTNPVPTNLIEAKLFNNGFLLYPDYKIPTYSKALENKNQCPVDILKSFSSNDPEQQTPDELGHLILRDASNDILYFKYTDISVYNEFKGYAYVYCNDSRVYIILQAITI